MMLSKIVLLEVHRWTRGKVVLNSTSIISNDPRHWLRVGYVLLVYDEDDDDEEELWVVQ